jgi:hypothetical protein
MSRVIRRSSIEVRSTFEGWVASERAAMPVLSSLRHDDVGEV